MQEQLFFIKKKTLQLLYHEDESFHRQCMPGNLKIGDELIYPLKTSSFRM